MKFYSKKLIELKNADIHLHYANNAGRGDNNVTITIVKPGQKREIATRYYGENCIKQYTVSGWRGNVNVPSSDIKFYGGLREVMK